MFVDDSAGNAPLMPLSGVPAAAILATGLALAGSTGPGLAVGVGGFRLGRYRWLHHALYGAAVVSCMLTVAVGIVAASPVRWAMAIVLVPLAALTHTCGGTSRHVALAATGLVLYIGVLTIAAIT